MAQPPTALQRQHAAVLYGVGDLRVELRAVRPPAADEALVAVSAVGICGSDLSYFKGSAKYEVREPFILGHEAAGTVVGLGPDAGRSAVSIGDRVALVPGTSCGHCDLCQIGLDNLCPDVRYLGSAAANPHVDGALQQFILMSPDKLLPVPDSVTDASAALLEPLAVADHAVQRAQVDGQRVLVIGGGAIGQLVALLAARVGADSVTVSDLNPRRTARAVEHGADRGLSPEGVAAISDRGRGYDVVIEATGSPSALSLALSVLRPGTGRLVVVGNLPAGTTMHVDMLSRTEVSVTAILRFPGGLRRALDHLRSGLDVDWLVERTYPLSDTPAALAAGTKDDPPLKIHILPSAGQ